MFSTTLILGAGHLFNLLGIRMCIFASCHCTDYARASYVGTGAGEAHVACVTFAVGGAVWPCRAIVPDLHLHRQRTPINYIYLSQSYLNVSDCLTHI